MTRHTRRCWRRTATTTALAIALAAEAAQIAVLAVHDRSAGELAAAVALAYLSVVTLCGAASWSWTAGRSAALDRRRPVPSGRPAKTAEAIVEHRARAQAEEDAHAEAMAVVAADAPLPERTECPQESVYDAWMVGVPTDGTPALLATVPMPPVGAVLSWDSGTHGRHVADAQPWPWSPMASARHVATYAMGEGGATGRHAGRWAA